MRKGERVKLNEEMTKQVIDRATYIPSDKILAFYFASYLPIMSDCLASIADSLEILTKELEEAEKLADVEKRIFEEDKDEQKQNN